MNTEIPQHEVVDKLRFAVSQYNQDLSKLVGRNRPSSFSSPETLNEELKEYFEKTLNPLIKTFISLDIDARFREGALIRLAEFQRCARRITKACHPKGVKVNRDVLRDAVINEADTIALINSYANDLDRDFDILYRQVHVAKTHQVRFDLVEFRDALKALMPIALGAATYYGNYVLVDVSARKGEMIIYANDHYVTGIKKMSCRVDTDSDFSFGIQISKSSNRSNFSLVELLSTYDEGKIDLELFEYNYIVTMKINELSGSSGMRIHSKIRLNTIDDNLERIKVSPDNWEKLFSVPYNLYKEHYDSYKSSRKSGEYTPENHFSLWFWDAIKLLSGFNRDNTVESYINIKIENRDISLVVNNGQACVEAKPYIHDIYEGCQNDFVISVDGKRLKKMSSFFEKSEAYVFLSDKTLIFQSVDGLETIAIDCDSVRDIDEYPAWHTTPERECLAEGTISVKDGKTLKGIVNSVRKDKYYTDDLQGIEFVFDSERVIDIKTRNTHAHLEQHVDWVFDIPSDDVQTTVIDEVKVLLSLENVRLLKKSLSKLMGSKNIPYVFWYDISLRETSGDVYSERYTLTLYGNNLEIVLLMDRLDLNNVRVDNYSRVQKLAKEFSSLKESVMGFDKRLLEYPAYDIMNQHDDFVLDLFEAPEEWKELFCALSNEDFEIFKRFYMIHVEMQELISDTKGHITYTDLMDYDPFEKQPDSFDMPDIEKYIQHFEDSHQTFFQNMTLEEALDNNCWGWWANSNASVLYAAKQSRQHRTIVIKKSYYRKDLQDYLADYEFVFEVLDEYDDTYRILMHVSDEQVIRSNSDDERSEKLDAREFFLLQDDVIKMKASSDHVTLY